MCRERQQGLGLISAIFLIVVIAAIAVGVVSLVRTQSVAFAQDVLSERAFLAAESGAELGLNRVFAPVGTPSCVARTFDLSQTGLESCAATVACSTTVVLAETQYTLESAGRCGVGSDVAERRVVVRAQP